MQDFKKNLIDVFLDNNELNASICSCYYLYN